jgi:uncharacterized protein
MNKGHIYFEIQADDPKRAIEFYGQTLGWKFSEVPGLPVPYSTIETGGSRGGLLKRPAKTHPPQAARMLLSARSKWRVSTQPPKQYWSWAGSLLCLSSQFPVRVGKATSSTLEGNTFGIFEVDPHAGK